jgi:hypothetical protein
VQIAVALSLNHPSPEMEDRYEHFAIVAVRDAAYFFACTVGIMLIPRVVVWWVQEFCTINVIEFDEFSSGAPNHHLLQGSSP